MKSYGLLEGLLLGIGSATKGMFLLGGRDLPVSVAVVVPFEDDPLRSGADGCAHTRSACGTSTGPSMEEGRAWLASTVGVASGEPRVHFPSGERRQPAALAFFIRSSVRATTALFAPNPHTTL